MNELLEFINKYNNRINILSSAFNKNKDKLDLLIQNTLFLDKYYNREIKISERIYCILNKIDSIDKIPLCSVCNINHVRFNHSKSISFTEYCSIKCSSNRERSEEERKLIIEKRRKTSLEKYGVSHISKIEKIKDKKKETAINNFGSLKAAYSDTSKNIIIEKYGVDNISKSEYYKEKIRKNMYDKNIKILEESDNIIPITEYVSYYDKMKWKCLKCGNEFISSYKNIYEGSRCLVCNPYIRSNAELEIKSFLEEHGIDVKNNCKDILSSNKELDLYIPSKNIAIEYDGLYWHSNKFKDSKYHLEKLEECNAIGIRLIHVFEDEWVYKKSIVENRLLQILNIGIKEKIHARKCIIKEINACDKDIFLNAYHIQGVDKSRIKLGLFYNNELVAVMTFSKGNISKGSKNKDKVWELNRFCINYNYNIPGAASKLLEYFKRNYEWDEIFSYADRRWSVGNVYEKIGFKFFSMSTPNYWYTNGHTRIHRFNLRKRSNEPKDKTEFELRSTEGWNWIYDCGSIKYVLRNVDNV